MDKSRLLRLFQAFAKEDMKQFERFLHSPYHNRSQQCIVVFNCIKLCYERETLHALNKGRLFQMVLQDIKKINTLEVIMSKLARLAEDFIALETLNKHNYLKKHLLLEGLFEQEKVEYSKVILKALKQKRTYSVRKGMEYYFEEYLLSRDQYIHSHYLEDKQTQQHLGQHIHALDEFYLIERLRLAYEIANRKTMQPVDYDEEQVEKIMELAVAGNLRQNPLIDLFYTTLLTLKEQDNEQHFERLLVLIEEHHHQISKQVLDDLYTTLANFCVTKIISGETQYMQTLFLLRQTQTEQGNLFLDRFISAQLVKNIVALGGQLGAFEWTDEFLESHARHLKPEIRDSVYHFNKGVLAFYQHKYKEAMTHLNQTDKMELSYELGRKTILLRSYYELKESIAFEALSKSFKEYVRSQKGMTGRLKKAYVNFTSVLGRLENIRQKGDYQKIDALIEKINAYEFLSNKPWLLEKVEELRLVKM